MNKCKEQKEVYKWTNLNIIVKRIRSNICPYKEEIIQEEKEMFNEVAVEE